MQTDPVEFASDTKKAVFSFGESSDSDNSNEEKENKPLQKDKVQKQAEKTDDAPPRPLEECVRIFNSEVYQYNTVLFLLTTKGCIQMLILSEEQQSFKSHILC